MILIMIAINMYTVYTQMIHEQCMFVLQMNPPFVAQSAPVFRSQELPCSRSTAGCSLREMSSFKSQSKAVLQKHLFQLSYIIIPVIQIKQETHDFFKRHFSQQQTASSNCILKTVGSIPTSNCPVSQDPIAMRRELPVLFGASLGTQQISTRESAGWLDVFFWLLRCLAVPPAISTKVPNSLPGLGSLCRGVVFLGDKDLGECFGHRKFFERKAEESSFSNFLGKFCQY